MKKIFFLIAITSLCISCQNKKEGKIEMISTEQLYDAIKNENPQLVDVRTTNEYSVKHLKNAQNICVTSDDFKEKVAQLDKEKPVYVYCKRGGQSAQAAIILKEMGFTKVYDLQGGIDNWESQGLETVN